jgi:hypothetical protein
MRECGSHIKLDVGNQSFSDIDYADDGALLNNTPLEWQKILIEYEEAANTMGLHTNWSKTKIQNIGAGSTPDPVLMGNQTVEPVTKFTYLGSVIDSEGYSLPEIHRRLGLANSVMGQLDIVWRQKNLSLKTKLKIYMSVVLPVLIYGSETWTLRKVDSARVQAFHMTCQRRILGVKWQQHITNADIQSRTHLPDLTLIIADRRHSLFGHVCRMSQLTPAKKILDLCISADSGSLPGVDWKRPRGRPRQTWLAQIKEKLGCEPSEAQQRAMGRSVWRTLRPSAGRAQ